MQPFHPKFFHFSLGLKSEHGNQIVSVKILKKCSKYSNELLFWKALQKYFLGE